MEKTKRWEIWGAGVSIVFGSLLHFMYQWSGNMKIAALFAAVNESTWEHLKIAFWPTLIFAVIEWFYFGKHTKNFFLANFVKLFSIPLIIIILFYGWTAILPDNFFWDISIFIVAIVVGYALSYEIIKNKYQLYSEMFWIILIIIGICKFSLFTYLPPHIFLMHDPVNGGYGIEK